MSELERIRSEFARRTAESRLAELHDPLCRANLFAAQGKGRALVELLRREGITTLAGKRVLDLGCGSGGELHRLLGFGASPQLLHGLDLIAERLVRAREIIPHLCYTQGNAANLPYEDAAFDLVCQHTVFSSILEAALRQRVAGEMLRVLRPAGLIVWYDFWTNPTNPATIGLRPREIKRLFAGCRCRFARVMLAPPIARRVVPLSWGLAQLLEAAPFLRSHYLASIRKAPGSG